MQTPGRSGVKDLGQGLSDVPFSVCQGQALGGNRRQKAVFTPEHGRASGVAALLSPQPSHRAVRPETSKPEAGASKGAASSPRSPEGRPRSPLPPQRRHLRPPDATFDGCVLCESPSRAPTRTFPESRHYRASSPLTWRQSGEEVRELREIGCRLIGEGGKPLATRRHASPEPQRDQVLAAAEEPEQAPQSPRARSELLFLAGDASLPFRALRHPTRRGLAGEAARGQEVDGALPTRTAVRPGAAGGGGGADAAAGTAAAAAGAAAAGTAAAAGMPSAHVDVVHDVSSRRFDFFEAQRAASPAPAPRRLADGLRPEVQPQAESAPQGRARGRGPREPERQVEGLALLPAGRERRLTWSATGSPARSNRRGDFLELRSPSPGRAASPASPRRLSPEPAARAEAARAEAAAAEAPAKPREAAGGRKLTWGALGAGLDAASTAAPSPAASPPLSRHGSSEDGFTLLGEAMRMREAEAARWRQRSPRGSRASRAGA